MYLIKNIWIYFCIIKVCHEDFTIAFSNIDLFFLCQNVRKNIQTIPFSKLFWSQKLKNSVKCGSYHLKIVISCNVYYLDDPDLKRMIIIKKQTKFKVEWHFLHFCDIICVINNRSIPRFTTVQRVVYKKLYS